MPGRASMDSDGYLRIEGRVKDIIIRGGENIYPREIEDVLFARPGVAESAVVGVPDEKWARSLPPSYAQHRASPARLRRSCARKAESAWRRSRRRCTGYSWTHSR